MSRLVVDASQLSGTLKIPSSKSETVRAIIFGSLAKGISRIRNPLITEDTHALIKSLSSFGAGISLTEDECLIEGINGPPNGADNVIDVGNSGIALRFLTAIAAASSLPIVITGDRSIRENRPMQELLSGLNQLGAKAVSTRGKGYAPLIIQGPIKGGKASILGSDSQPVSALLIAASLTLNPVEIFVSEPGEKPFVDMTAAWLKRLDVKLTRNGYNYYKVESSKSLPGFDFVVPGDWSTAAFPIAAAFTSKSTLVLENLDFNDAQGDKKIVDILQSMGGIFEINEYERRLTIHGQASLRGIEIDLNDCIDAVPILSVVACFAEGKTHLKNIKIARTKECDRLSACAEELTKMGAFVEEREDELIIQGQSQLRGAKVSSRSDHRMALALAVAAFGAEGTTTIDDWECSAKTFPDFTDYFQTLGASCKRN